MFGIRTPCKPRGAEQDSQNSTSGPGSSVAGPSNPTSGVRRSIGEWEAGKPENRKSLTPPKSAVATGSSKAKPSTLRRLSTEATGSPPGQVDTKYADRVSEAKACVLKAKLNLGRSGNLKREIKTEVHLAIDRLYQLVKEAESAKTQGKNATEGRENVKEQRTKKEEENKDNAQELARTMEEHMKLLRESNGKMEELKQAMERKTYASAVSASPRRSFPAQTALHSVIVTGKDEMETGEEVLEKIRKAVNAKEGGVAVERIRKAKDRKIIVACRTEDERQKIKERLAKSTELNVEEIKNKDPLVIFRDVFLYNSDEEVLRALRNQNSNIFGSLKQEDDRCEVAYKKRTRNPHTSHIVMRVSPKLWQLMVEAETVHIDLQRVRVLDQSPLVQCSLCLGYGHGRRFCKETLERCSHCGGPHVKAQCAEWLANALPSCCNCVHAKLDKTDHNAFSSECVIRRKWEAIARATIAYC